MKKRIIAKIGTHSSTSIVLWSSKDISIGDKITGMESSIYDSLHSAYRRLKKCQYWETYKVTDINPILFLDKF